MTRAVAAHTQASLTSRGLTFLHITPTFTESCEASEAYERFAGTKAPPSFFDVTYLDALLYKGAPYVFIEGASAMGVAMLNAVIKLAVSAPTSKHKPVIFYVG